MLAQHTFKVEPERSWNCARTAREINHNHLYYVISVGVVCSWSATGRRINLLENNVETANGLRWCRSFVSVMFIVYSTAAYIMYETKIRNRYDRIHSHTHTQTHTTNTVSGARCVRIASEVMMVPFVRVSSHTEPICVIHRVIMANRPFSCGHQTTSKQPFARQKQRAKCRQREKRNFSSFC